MRGAVPPARISAVLVTDALETVRPVLERLRAQTIRDALEVVLVVPRRDAVDGVEAELDGVAAVRVVERPGPIDLPEARADGVRAASAPYVFVGETHSYPHARCLETLAAAHDSDGEAWAVVVPGFASANPGGALSWAGFLTDYATWAAELPRREITYAPIYNASYRRDVLISLGDRLTRAFAHGDTMLLALRAGGRRILFEPAARIDHLNVARARPYLREHYLSGRLIGGERSRRWPRRRRAVYALASPLLPAVYLSRAWPGVQAVRREQTLPRGTLAAMATGAVATAVGELFGYVGGWHARADTEMTQYELHKLRYAATEPS